MRIALVVMPFAAADSPSLAAGLLKSELAASGIACDVKYFNVTFALMLGVQDYRTISTMFTSTALAGEWVFARAFDPGRVSNWETYRRDVLSHPRWGLAEENHALVRRAHDLAPLFLEAVFDSNDWGRYDLIGFTSTFEQTMPSLCLARRIRSELPAVKIAFGGANFEQPMGSAFMRSFEFIDYACTGEGDASFPELCTRLAAGVIDIPPGIVSRSSEPLEAARPFVRLDELPTPDYDDYFRVLDASRDASALTPWLPVEASRGCWWGQKAHCTFCGLNGDGMVFRRKGWRRVVEETDALEARYGSRWIQFTDNILAAEYFTDLLPYWAEHPRASPKFFEVKSGLRRDQISLLRRSGVVAVQAGVESFSTRTLRIIRKGVTGAMNLAVLRWCAELGLRAHWNLLYGFPGENLAEYTQQLELIRQIVHLDAPEACSMIRMDRFSPNYERSAEMGFTSVRPVPAYAHVFPVPAAEIPEIAYFFDYEHPNMARAESEAMPLAAFCTEWKQAADSGANGTLAARPHLDGGFVMVDTRLGHEPSAHRLDAIELEWLLACDAPVSEKAVIRYIPEVSPSMDEKAIRSACAHLIAKGWIARIDGRLVTLALLGPEIRIAVPARETWRLEAQTTSKEINDGELREVPAHG